MLKQRGRWRVLFGLKPGLWYIEPDPEGPGPELTRAERRNLQIANRTFWATVISALAALGAGYIFYLQFKQMSSQTSILNKTLLQAAKDSKDSSTATQTQLELAQKSLAAIQAQVGTAQQSVVAIQKQAAAAQRQMETAQRQLELSERPWVTLKDNSWQISWDTTSTFVGRKDGSMQQNYQLNFRVDYELRNSGRSPATRAFVSMQAAPAGGRSYRPDAMMGWACSSAESQRKEAENPTLSGSGRGTVVFPQATVNRGWVPNIAFPADQAQVFEGAWIAACVVYQAGFSQHVYHTKLWFRSVSGPGIIQPVPIQQGLPYTWKPFQNFVLTDSEAD
jgi:hypothetical protein